MTRETWRQIPGLSRYKISNLGRVRTLALGYILPGNVGARYVRHTLTDDTGKRRGHYAHILVAEAFIGPRPPGLDVLHRDDDALNNAAENLYYGTDSENQHDAVRNGHHGMARKTHCKRNHPLTGANVRPVRTGGRECVACKFVRYRRSRVLRAIRLVGPVRPIPGFRLPAFIEDGTVTEVRS